MSRPPARRPRVLLLVAALATILLWLFFDATARDPIFGVGAVRFAIETASVGATALLFVVAGGWLLLGLAASREGAAALTGLQRVLLYGLLAFIASFVALRHFDIDLGAVLTTSAIITAAIGFAMQPTLGSLISGITLTFDRMPRVGDGILLNGQRLRIEALSWRRVVARRSDGGIVILPNAQLADHMVEILPYDAPVGAEIFFRAPFAVPPQRIGALATEVISDFPHVDAGSPIAVVPVEYDPTHPTQRYRIDYSAHRYGDIDELEGEVVRRLWYVFQRQRLWRPGDGVAWQAPEELARLVAGLALPWLPADPEAALTLARSGEVLLFAPGERLTFPGWTAGRQFLLLKGEAVGAEAAHEAVPAVAVHEVVPSVALHRAREELMQHIGPYAEHAVRRAAQPGRRLDEIFGALAEEIPDEAARRRFLDRVLPAQTPGIGPGSVLETYRNAAGSLVCAQPLRARGEVTILAIPPRPAVSAEAEAHAASS